MCIPDKPRSGTIDYYSHWKREERQVTVDEDLNYLEYMTSLCSETFPLENGRPWLSTVASEPTSQWIQIQPWCEAALDTEYGAYAHWPDKWSDCTVVWLPSKQQLEKLDKDPALKSVPGAPKATA